MLNLIKLNFESHLFLYFQLSILTFSFHYTHFMNMLLFNSLTFSTIEHGWYYSNLINVPFNLIDILRSHKTHDVLLHLCTLSILLFTSDSISPILWIIDSRFWNYLNIEFYNLFIFVSSFTKLTFHVLCFSPTSPKAIRF